MRAWQAVCKCCCAGIICTRATHRCLSCLSSGFTVSADGNTICAATVSLTKIIIKSSIGNILPLELLAYTWTRYAKQADKHTYTDTQTHTHTYTDTQTYRHTHKQHRQTSSIDASNIVSYIHEDSNKCRVLCDDRDVHSNSDATPVDLQLIGATASQTSYECSNQGHCNSVSGQCECISGYHNNQVTLEAATTVQQPNKSISPIQFVDIDIVHIQCLHYQRNYLASGSDGEGGLGSRGDCGYLDISVTGCAGGCNGHGFCQDTSGTDPCVCYEVKCSGFCFVLFF